MHIVYEIFPIQSRASLAEKISNNIVYSFMERLE